MRRKKIIENPNPKAIGYIRVYADFGNVSEELQRMAIEHKAQSIGLKIDEWVVDYENGLQHYDGRKTLRDTLKRMNRSDSLIVYRLNRLTMRSIVSVRLIEMCKHFHWYIHSYSEPTISPLKIESNPEDRIIVTIAFAQSEYEETKLDALYQRFELASALPETYEDINMDSIKII